MANLASIPVTIFVLMCAFLTVPGFAESDSRTEMVRISRPLNPNKASSPRFVYTAQFRHPVGDAPTIVFMPGGPGDTSIGEDFDFHHYPEEFGIILTDPRGVGANYNAAIPTSALTSENVADDVLALIKHLKLASYILNGQSYGTVIATIIGTKWKKVFDTAPLAVVLEGVVGKAVGTRAHEGVHDVYLPIADQALAALDANLRERMQLNVAQLIAQGKANASELGYVVEETLREGSVLNADGAFAQTMIQLAELDPLSPISVTAKKGEKSGRGTSRFQNYVGCREIEVVLRQGPTFDGTFHLITDRKDECDDVLPVSERRPYDSAQWQIDAPMIYINGELDPATPIGRARYHYAHQTSSHKFFFAAPGAGHGPTANEFANCATAFYRSITAANIESGRVFDAFAGCH
jgi:pimeloyl-ACP methyl ester carboxylesterase